MSDNLYEIVLTLEEALEHLEEQSKIHLQLTMDMLSADSGQMYPLDLLALSASKRSMSLINGFVSMIKARNFICAAPLIRLQLDNSLRFYAAFLVDEPHELAKAFIDGESIRNFKEIGSKEKLTDRILVDRLSIHHAWIKEAYKQASGYIHLSEKHFFNVIGRKAGDDKLSLIASEKDHFITDLTRFEAVIMMIKSTTVFLWILNSWKLTKETPNPEEWNKKHGKKSFN